MVQIKCRKCGRSSDATTFVLDPLEKMMICALCVKDRKVKKTAEMIINRRREAVQPTEDADSDSPVGWDKEDEILEKIHKDREEKGQEQPTVTVGRIDDDRVRYNCPKCSYSFVYNVKLQRPQKCSYCGALVSTKFRVVGI